MKRMLTLLLALLMLCSAALAEAPSYSPEMTALKTANALMYEKYGFTWRTLGVLSAEITPADSSATVTYRSYLLPASRMGEYTVTIAGGSISGSNAVNGGAVYAISGSTLVLDGATIENSTAENSGGAVFSHNTPVTVQNSSITNSHASSGGAISSSCGTDLTAELTVTDTTISGCSATDNGGAIVVAGNDGATANVTIGGSTEISGCETGANGGAVYINIGTLTITGGKIHGNTAQNQGGAIYLSGSNVSATMSGGDIYENNTANGGAVNVGSTSNIFEMCGGYIRNNIAGSYIDSKTGETVYSNVCGITVNGTFNMTGGEVSNNIGKYDAETGKVAGNVHWSDIVGSGSASIHISGGTITPH